ncbi:O-antigen ligase family protein [Oscillatoria acuminata]|uniref:Lipid A core-O-antigen ligase-like enyme n=1 Tax=Oscillatoria acuminata PCC 6304 TaxID=56110 RepID=K9TGY2_9CYAN|nr:O-antigen ligase family protein [Oscillatoria acuminata]AFY81396.1 lipid A core-O-antigen ligase-like enyme [Oscillatoria acuminata PCC 6304]
MLKQAISSWYFILFIFLFLRPYPIQYIGHLGVRVLDLLILLLILLLLAYKSKKWKSSLPPFFYVIAFALLLMSGLVILSMLIGSYYSLPISYRDFLESFRYSSYICYVLFGIAWTKYSTKSLEFFFKAVLIILGTSCFFSIFQSLFSDHFLFLTKLYATDRQAQGFQGTNRVTSIFGNPNTTGIMTLLLAAIIIAYFRSYKNILDKSIKRNLIFIICISLYVVLITGSRTSFIVLLIGLLGFLAYQFKSKKSIFFIALGSISIFTLGNTLKNIIIALSPAYLHPIVNYLFVLDVQKILLTKTLAARFQRWDEALEYFKLSPLFGVGPLRLEVPSSTDNFYVYILARYGIIGLLVFLGIWLYVFHLAKKSQSYKNRSLCFISQSLIYQSVIILIANLTLEAQIIIPIAYLYFISLGLLIGNLSFHKKLANKNQQTKILFLPQQN